MSEAASWIGEALESGAKAVEGRMEQSSLGRGVLNILGNKGYELGLTEEGRTIRAINDEYWRLHAQALDQETKKLAAVRQWYQSDDAVRNTLPIKTSTMAQYHAQAVAMGHPIQAITKSILDADPGNAALTQRELMVRNEQLARLKALPGSYGAEFEHVTPIIARMRQSADPRIVQLGQRYADIVSNEVRDTKMMTSYTGQKGLESVAKVNMNKAFQSANKIYEKLELPKIPLLDSTATYYKQEEPERLAHRVLNMMLIPFVAIPHIGQLFNPPASSPLEAIGATLMRMNHDDMQQTVDAAAITANTAWQTMYENILGETGKVAEFTNNPTLGKILSRSIHQPGFQFIRNWQLNLAGSVGFHSAIYWAHNFAESGSKIAEARLREIGIDPAEVLKQGGQLTEEQLQKGVFHYTNNRMFFSKSIDNSLWQNRNPIARSMMMYKSFVNSQATFMQRELTMMLKNGDLKGLAQYVGTIGILFPAVAPLLTGAEVLARTGSIKQAQQEVQNRYQRLISPAGAGDWVSNYLGLISHLGTYGIFLSYINAMRAHRFAAAILGPMGGLLTTDAEDAWNAAFNPSARSGHNVKPLERDMLKQTIPVFGSELAHHLVPTKKEQSSGGGSRGFRLRSGGLRRRF